MPTTVGEIVQLVEGRLLAGRADTLVSGVVVDSNKAQPGDLFVAFVGKNADGHRFIPDAVARGVRAVLVTHEIPALPDPELAVIQIENSLSAVQRLANHQRRTFSGPVIGVTGSNGKTTTKEMLARIFGVQGACLYTQANLNTELGLPLTLLRRNESHQSIVLEMGMRGLGQIAELCEIAEPTAGIITNIGQSHIELLGSQENIARAKTELLAALPTDGFAALPASDPWLQKYATRSEAPILWYDLENGEGQGHDASPTRPLYAFAQDIESVPNGVSFTACVGGEVARIQLPTFGNHNVMNALGALALGKAYGLSLVAMARSLETLEGTAGRLNVQAGPRGMTVIDDCYNASPLSMHASLGVLRDLSASKAAVAILGDMYELGEYAEAGHREVGQVVRQLDIDILMAVGPMAKWIGEEAQGSGCRVYHVPDRESAVALLGEVIPDQSVVLVKASRGMGLERIVEALLAH